LFVKLTFPKVFPPVHVIFDPPFIINSEEPLTVLNWCAPVAEMWVALIMEQLARKLLVVRVMASLLVVIAKLPLKLHDVAVKAVGVMRSLALLFDWVKLLMVSGPAL